MREILDDLTGWFQQFVHCLSSLHKWKSAFSTREPLSLRSVFASSVRPVRPVRRYSGRASSSAGRLVFILCLCFHACIPLATKPCIVCGFCKARSLTTLGGEDGERLRHDGTHSLFSEETVAALTGPSPRPSFCSPASFLSHEQPAVLNRQEGT